MISWLQGLFVTLNALLCAGHVFVGNVWLYRDKLFTGMFRVQSVSTVRPYLVPWSALDCIIKGSVQNMKELYCTRFSCIFIHVMWCCRRSRCCCICMHACNSGAKPSCQLFICRYGIRRQPPLDLNVRNETRAHSKV